MALRVGRISYTNDLPIYSAFDEGAVAFPGTLVSDVPAKLNRMLLAGGLDLSPISAFFYAQHADELALLGDLCIGSRNEVWSVILASPVGPDALGGAAIAVTKESASGRNLLQVLLERRYGVRASFVEDDDALTTAVSGSPALLIGDSAIDAQYALGPRGVYDLGSLWHEWTDLDMVYAVWAVRRDVLRERPAEVAAAFDALRASRAWGLANQARVIAAAERVHARGEGFYAAYYETLNFSFDEQARAGLKRFVEESVLAGTLAATCPTEPEVVRVSG